MSIEPYLFFNGRAEEAIDLYERALGARIEMLMRYRESPEPIPDDRLPSGFADKVMHASLLIGKGRVMMSDGCEASPMSPGGFALSLALPDEAEARRAFEALAADGRIDLPIGRTFWSPCFGMVTDRLGVRWMVTVADNAVAG